MTEEKQEEKNQELTKAVDVINKLIFTRLPRQPSKKSQRSPELVEELKSEAEAKRQRKYAKRLANKA